MSILISCDLIEDQNEDVITITLPPDIRNVEISGFRHKFSISIEPDVTTLRIRYADYHLKEGNFYSINIKTTDYLYSVPLIIGDRKKLFNTFHSLEFDRNDHSVLNYDSIYLSENYTNIELLKLLLIRLRRSIRGRGSKTGFLPILHSEKENDWRNFRYLVERFFPALKSILNSRYIVSIIETYADFGEDKTKAMAQSIANYTFTERFAFSLHNIYHFLPKLFKIKDRQIPMWDGLASNRLLRDDVLQINLGRQIALLNDSPILMALFSEITTRSYKSSLSLLSINAKNSHHFKLVMEHYLPILETASRKFEVPSIEPPKVTQAREKSRKIDSIEIQKELKSDIILHVGMPKTGSSALQMFFKQYRSSLKSQGIYYPDHSIDSNGVSGGHSIFGQMILNGDIAEARRWIVDQHRIAKEYNCRLLVSSEALYKYPERLGEVTLGIGSVSVLMFCRPSWDSVWSNYQQSVKRHAQKKSFIEFSWAFLKDRSENKTINIASALKQFYPGKCLFDAYTVSFYKEHSLRDRVCELLGVDFNYENDIRINAGYMPEAIELKRVLNSFIGEDRALNKEVDEVLQKYSDQYFTGQQSHEKEYSYCPDWIIQSTRDDMDLILKEYIVDSPCKEVLQRKAIVTQNYLRSEYSIEGLYTKAIEANKSLHIKLKNKAQAAVELGEPDADLECETLNRIFQFNLPYIPKTVVGLDSGKINKIVSNSYTEADVLREISFMLQKEGRIEEAYKVVTKALSIRPNGPVLKSLRDSLVSQLEAPSGI